MRLNFPVLQMLLYSINWSSEYWGFTVPSSKLYTKKLAWPSWSTALYMAVCGSIDWKQTDLTDKLNLALTDRAMVFHPIQHILETFYVSLCICRDRRRSCLLFSLEYFCFLKSDCTRWKPSTSMISHVSAVANRNQIDPCVASTTSDVTCTLNAKTSMFLRGYTLLPWPVFPPHSSRLQWLRFSCLYTRPQTAV